MLVHSSQQCTTEKFKAIHGVVRRIPKGNVASYGQVAALAQLPGRARLAGKALGATLNQTKIPWHRVLRADGKIAFGADTERYHLQITLLESEGVTVENGRVSMAKFQWEPNFYST